jgi:HSP20 family protein
MAKETKRQGEDAEKTVNVKKRDIQKVAPTRALSPFEEMERFFEGAFPRGWLRPFRREWPAWAELAAPFEGRMPKVDVIDRDEEVVVHAELPGVDKEDVDVSLAEDRLTIKGSTKKEHTVEKGDYFRSEISQGSFSRTIVLPAAVDGEKAKATFSDGILELTMPKLERTRRKSIKVE